MIFIFFSENNNREPLQYYQYLSKDPINVEETHQLKEMLHTKFKSAEHDLSFVVLGMGDIDTILNRKLYCNNRAKL